MVEVDCKALALDQACFLWIRVEIPLDKLLRKGGQVVSLKGDRVRLAYKYERPIGLCFQCGRVGHKANRCPYPYKGTTKNRPYREWLRAGNRIKPGAPRSTEDCPPWHSLALAPLTSPTDPWVVDTLRLTLVNVVDNTKTQGGIKANTCEGGKFGIRGTDKEWFSPQITRKLPTDPDTLKPNPMATDFTLIQICQPHDSLHWHFMVSDIPVGDLLLYLFGMAWISMKIKGVTWLKLCY